MKSRMKNETRQQDPREAILKFAEEAKNDPYWIAPAYKKAGNVLAEKVYEDENEAAREEKKRRRK